MKEVASINTFTPDPTKKGWFIQLYKDGDGHQLEKVLAKPSLFNQLLYFTTYTHDDDADPCSAAGTSKEYLVEFLSGGGALAVDELSDLSGGALGSVQGMSDMELLPPL